MGKFPFANRHGQKVKGGGKRGKPEARALARVDLNRRIEKGPCGKLETCHPFALAEPLRKRLKLLFCFLDDEFGFVWLRRLDHALCGLL